MEIREDDRNEGNDKCDGIPESYQVTLMKRHRAGGTRVSYGQGRGPGAILKLK